MTAEIQRDYIRIGDRHVHVRRGGRGAALLLLHQSPQSSRALLPWMRTLVQQYHVIAPDTPGFGESDPLPRQQPDLADQAAHLDLLLDALAIDRVLVWGVHTGASIACRLALDFPHRVALLVCDGLPSFDRAEQAALLSRYLPPFEPGWDGSHLTWLWARLREQTLFWPWFEQTAAARLQFGQATPERLHNDVLDVLQAGDGYRLGYRTPFLPDDPGAVARLRVPAQLLYRVEDVLAPHCGRLPPLPDGVIAETLQGGMAALHARTGQALAQFASAATTVTQPLPAPAPVPGHPGRSLHRGSAGALAYRWVPRQRHAHLLLHDLGCSPGWSAGSHSATADDSLLIPALPGHGGSAEAGDPALDVEAMAAALQQLVDALPIDSLSVHASGLASGCAVALGERLGSRVRELHLHRPLPLDHSQQQGYLQQLPDLRPTRSGSHLLEAWNWARQRHLFLPWMEPVAAAACVAAAPAPLQIQADVLSLLQLGERLRPLMASAVACDWPARLSGLPCRVRLHRPAGFPLEAVLQALQLPLGSQLEATGA